LGQEIITIEGNNVEQKVWALSPAKGCAAGLFGVRRPGAAFTAPLTPGSGGGLPFSENPMKDAIRSPQKTVILFVSLGSLCPLCSLCFQRKPYETSQSSRCSTE
jgi:hypothetical protein